MGDQIVTVFVCLHRIATDVHLGIVTPLTALLMALALYLVDDQRLLLDEAVTTGDKLIVGINGVCQTAEDAADTLRSSDIPFTVHQCLRALLVEKDGILPVLLENTVGIRDTVAVKVVEVPVPWHGMEIVHFFPLVGRRHGLDDGLYLFLAALLLADGITKAHPGHGTPVTGITEMDIVRVTPALDARHDKGYLTFVLQPARGILQTGVVDSPVNAVVVGSLR